MGTPDLNLELTYSSTNAAEFPQPGTTFLSAGKKYCCVYNAGAAATVTGDVVGVFLTTPAAGHISMTAATQQVHTVNTVTLTLVAGVAISAIAASAYGWIQVGGISANTTTDTNIDATEALVCADNAKVASAGDQTMFHGIFGFAAAADAAAVGSAFLTNCAFDY